MLKGKKLVRLKNKKSVKITKRNKIAKRNR